MFILNQALFWGKTNLSHATPGKLILVKTLSSVSLSFHSVPLPLPLFFSSKLAGGEKFQILAILRQSTL